MAFMASTMTRPALLTDTHWPRSALPASSSRTIPSFRARSCLIAVARRANPPLGTPQPQGSISPITSLVCNTVNSMPCPGGTVGSGRGVSACAAVGGTTGVARDASAACGCKVGSGAMIVAGGKVEPGAGAQPDSTNPPSSSPISPRLCRTCPKEYLKPSMAVSWQVVANFTTDRAFARAGALADYTAIRPNGQIGSCASGSRFLATA